MALSSSLKIDTHSHHHSPAADVRQVKKLFPESRFGRAAPFLCVFYTAIMAIPKYIMCDFVLVTYFISTELKYYPNWGDYDTMRRLLQSLYESVFETLLQIILVSRGV